MRFLCPHCHLKLSCEDGYGGWRIECPGCKGAVIVPLPLPPPLPLGRTHAQVTVLSTAERWRRLGILAGAAIVLSPLSLLVGARLFGEHWAQWHSIGFGFSPSLFYCLLGALGFATGSALVSQSNDSLQAQIFGGCLCLLFPVLIEGFFRSAIGILGSGCMLMLGKSNGGLEMFQVSFVSFIVLAVVLSILVGLLNALKRR